jgi:exonuclease III
LQETRISERNEKDLTLIYDKLGIKHCDFHLQEDENDPGHGGVAVWVNPKTCSVIPHEVKDLGFSGRWQEIVIEFANKKIAIVNSYYHSANSPTYKIKGKLIDPKDSVKSMKAKHCFFDRTTERMRELISEYDNFILVGDINTAHHDIDIDTFKDSNTKTKAGFLPEERAWLDLWFAKKGDMNVKSTYVEGKTALEVYKYNPVIKYKPPETDEFTNDNGGLGLRDVIREKYGKDKIYSWWSTRPTPKVSPVYPFDRDVGWRIDYQIASESMADCVEKAKIQKYKSREKCWSDHAPVVVTYRI